MWERRIRTCLGGGELRDGVWAGEEVSRELFGDWIKKEMW